MSTIILDMSSYAVELVYPDESEYDVEYFDSAWVPALAEQELFEETSVEIPSSLVNVDVEEFLRKMYESQR